MSFLAEFTTAMRNVFAYAGNYSPVKYSSLSEYRATQAACTLMLSEEHCAWVNQHRPEWVNVFKLFSPHITNRSDGSYAFNWNSVPHTMSCGAGRCYVAQSVYKNEGSISLEEVIGGILGGAYGCTVEEPRPFELPVVAFNDRVMFCINKDNLFKDYASKSEMDCLQKQDIPIDAISACIFLDALYEVTPENEIKLRPESRDINSLNQFLRNTDNKGFMVKFSGNNSMPHGTLGVVSPPMQPIDKFSYFQEISIFQQHVTQMWTASGTSILGKMMLLAGKQSSQIYAWMYDDLNNCSLLYEAPCKTGQCSLL